MKALFKNKIFIAGGIMLIITVAWFTLGGSSSSETAGVLKGTPSTGDGSATGTAGQDLIQTLTNLESISLDAPVFENPAFATLKDYSRQVVAEPVGKHDPFAPLGDVLVQSIQPINVQQTIATTTLIKNTTKPNKQPVPGKSALPPSGSTSDPPQ